MTHLILTGVINCLHKFSLYKNSNKVSLNTMTQPASHVRVSPAARFTGTDTKPSSSCRLFSLRLPTNKPWGVNLKSWTV